jgi:hypothetical protein
MGCTGRHGVDQKSSKTEILDVAPVDFLNGLTPEFLSGFPDELLSSELRAKAVDFEFHWVAKDNKVPSHCTAGINIVTTVRS